jgi:ribosomal protein L30E
MNSQKVINLLTICRKAGKLVTGFDVSLEAVIDGKSKCLLIASNTSPKTIKEINYRISSEGLEGMVEVLTMPLTIQDVAMCINVNAGVIAICDSGFSKAFKKLLV